MIEFRVCWSAATDVSFRGEGIWHQAKEGESAEEVELRLVKGRRSLPEGMNLALGESGFEWWVETRETNS
ncbi:MAG TPA: hypothetical protein VFS64_06950 [Solirubrobacterales bacterium]|nr:hypothetical protein [Solirubrobacterales bacterium]